MHRLVHHPHALELPRDLGRMVGGAVVDHDDLRLARRTKKLLFDGVEAPRDAMLLIEGGNDETHLDIPYVHINAIIH